MAALLGYECGILSLDSWRQTIHPDDRQSESEAFHAHLNGVRNVYEAEYRMRTTAGAYVWGMSKGHVVERESEGTPRRLAGTVTRYHPAQARRGGSARQREGSTRR